MNNLPYGIYGLGSRGQDVVDIQRALANIGYRIIADGIYGPITQNIIYNIQRKYPESLKADSIYGPKTRQYIVRLLSTGYRIVQNPGSILVLVNKMNSLPSDYVPKNLVIPNIPFTFSEFAMQKLMRREAAIALERLFLKAKTQGINLVGISGFRSYNRQAEIFARNVKASPNANLTSARPGESEHQTGLVMDASSPSVNNQLTQAFANTKEGIWLAKNAPDFGFIIRFPKGKEHITGYSYEPWHLRYVGEGPAKQIVARGLTLEEYLSQRY